MQEYRDKVRVEARETKSAVEILKHLRNFNRQSYQENNARMRTLLFINTSEYLYRLEELTIKGRG